MEIDRTILVDSRVGSKEFLDIFHALHKQDVMLCTLAFGDFAFMGRGPDSPIMVGIERKTIQDYIDSQHSGRLAGHQLPGLLAAYKVIYLIVEGAWRCNPADNRIEIQHHGKWNAMSYSRRIITPNEIIGYHNTLRIVQGIHIIYTRTDYETAAYVLGLQHWWCDKEYADHHAHLQIHTPKIAPRTATPLYRMALTLPRVSNDRARTICRHFKTIADLVAAHEADLVIPRHANYAGITPAAAAEIYKAIHS